MSRTPVVLVGDPHGRYDRIIAFCLALPRPGVAVLMGDLDLEAPFREVLGPLLAAAWSCRWVIGNHDGDSEKFYSNLVDDYPEGDLSGSVLEVDGVRYAGLGGVFRSKVWAPREGDEAPRFHAPENLVRQTPRQSRWRQGLPLRQRATIFRSAVDALAAQHADILLTHEAPLPHPYGWGGLNRLAAAMGAHTICYGHHHRSRTDTWYQPDGSELCCRGLAIEECYLISGDPE